MISSLSSLVFVCGFFVIVASVVAAVAAEEKDEFPCKEGSCPTPSNMMATDDESCGMWMGPSPIKEHEQHGFGLGIFTGKHIQQGQAVDEGILIPILDWDGFYRHPPLREQVWNGENIPTMSISSHWGTFYFLPGLGCIVPCTSKNPNLRNVHEFYEQHSPHEHAATGSFSRYKQSFFQAARDISPGEELTVDCSDDDFDGGTYSLSKFHSTSSNNNDDDAMCLDDTIHVQPTSSTSAGMGVYAKRNIQKGEVIISTPVVPLSRYETLVPNEIIDEYNVPNQRLILNYCYGHPNSDLLLLPLGPTVNYINHIDNANAQVQWHTPKQQQQQQQPLTKRQQYHHAELLELPPSVVADIHGKGLMFDYIATKDIQLGEEIFLDYGDSWSTVWKEHVAQWHTNQRDYHYQSSLEYYRSAHDELLTTLRTPKEQMNHPYPPNIMFTCLYSDTWQDPPEDITTVKHYYYEDENDNCIMPCTIEDRYEKQVQDEDDDENGEIKTIQLYRTRLIEVSNHTDVEFDCLLVPNVDYQYYDVPRDAIFVVDRPYTTDEFQPQAFRHEIHVPENMYPDIWLDNNKKVRRRQVVNVDDHTDHSFKRKQAKPLPQQKRVFF